MPVWNGSRYEASGFRATREENFISGTQLLDTTDLVAPVGAGDTQIPSPLGASQAANSAGTLILTGPANPGDPDPRRPGQVFESRINANTFTVGETYIMQFVDDREPNLGLTNGSTVVATAQAHATGVNVQDWTFNNVRQVTFDPLTGGTRLTTFTAANPGSEDVYVHVVINDVPPNLDGNSYDFIIGKSIAERTIPFISDGSGGIMDAVIPLTTTLNGDLHINESLSFESTARIISDVVSNNNITAARFIGDGILLENVGDRYASDVAADATTTLSPDTTTFFTTPSGRDTVTDAITTRVLTNLNWTEGQPIQFSAEFTAAGNIETAIIQGSVGSYNPLTGDLVISRLGGRWIGIASSVDIPNTGLQLFNLLSVQPTGQQGQQGERGERGFGVSATATTTSTGTSVDIVNEDGTQNASFFVANGAMGLQGPFTVSLYQISTADRTDPLNPVPNPPSRDDLPTGATWDNRNLRLDGGGILHTAPVADDDAWHTVRPDTINDEVYVVQITVTQVNATTFGVGQFSGIFMATSQGPAGPQGPQGTVGPAPRASRRFASSDAAANTSYSGTPSSNYTLNVPDGFEHDFGNYQWIFISTENTVDNTVMELNGLFGTHNTTANTISFLIVDEIRNDITSIDGDIIISASSPRGPSGIANITDNTSDSNFSGSDDTVTIAPTTLENLSLSGDVVRVESTTPKERNSVVPLEMVIDWVLYTSGAVPVSSTVELARSGTPGDTFTVTRLTYTQPENRRLANQVWHQNIGARFVGPYFVEDANFTVFHLFQDEDGNPSDTYINI